MMKPHRKLTMLILALGLLWATGVYAQPLVPPAQFDMTGFIQEATRSNVGAVQPHPLLRGGTLTINGIKMIVPNNTIVQFPASSWTWSQLFDPVNSASLGYNPPRPNHGSSNLGLSLNTPLQFHFPSCEVRVNGNISPDPVTGAPRYIVGLIVPVSQQGLNAASGIINFIDYDGTALPGGMPGRFRVGGVIGDPNTGALCEINDPVGRFGALHSPDPRFTCDTNNPTISAVTGFPVGIPRVTPPAIDPLCPLTNRPLNGDVNFPFDPFLALGAPLRTFDMPAPGPGVVPDATQQVPLMVGDWVDFSGTLMKVDPLGASTAANMFMSIHTLTANLGIYTQPGTRPAYINASVLIGTGAASNPPTPAGIAEEISTRITTEGFCTDWTNFVDFYAIDVHPTTGAETLRLLGTALPEAGPARPRGRWRFIVGKGAFTPVTREYIAKTRTGQIDNVANGLTAGQYRLPCFDYIFSEGTIMGQPIVSFNFQNIPFLAQGCGPLNGTGPVVRRLDPWPGP